MKKNDLIDDISFEEEFNEEFKSAKNRTNQAFLYIACLMIVLFLLGLGAIFFLVAQSNTAQIEREKHGPTYDKEALIFPEGIEDWKFAYMNLEPVYYCEIGKRWYRCYPTGGVR